MLHMVDVETHSCEASFLLAQTSADGEVNLGYLDSWIPREIKITYDFTKG